MLINLLRPMNGLDLLYSTLGYKEGFQQNSNHQMSLRTHNRNCQIIPYTMVGWSFHLLHLLSSRGHVFIYIGEQHLHYTTSLVNVVITVIALIYIAMSYGVTFSNTHHPVYLPQFVWPLLACHPLMRYHSFINYLCLLCLSYKPFVLLASFCQHIPHTLASELTCCWCISLDAKPFVLLGIALSVMRSLTEGI